MLVLHIYGDALNIMFNIMNNNVFIKYQVSMNLNLFLNLLKNVSTLWLLTFFITV